MAHKYGSALYELPWISQVAIYNYMKLQMIRTKASLSTAKDVEKLAGRDASMGTDTAPLLAPDVHKVLPPANGYTSFRCAAREASSLHAGSMPWTPSCIFLSCWLVILRSQYAERMGCRLRRQM